MMVEITSENVESLVGGKLPLVIEFWTIGCGPCKVVSSILEQLAKEYDGRVVIGKCNVEEEGDVAIKYNIRNASTVLFFKDGKQVDKYVSAGTKDLFKKKIEALL